MVINNKDKTITVKATYYHNIITGTYARNGVDFWNKQTGHTYTDENGDQYKIIFDLRNRRVDKPEYAAEKDPAGNSFTIKNIDKKRRKGNPSGTLPITR